jgi:hypothetical protein
MVKWKPLFNETEPPKYDTVKRSKRQIPELLVDIPTLGWPFFGLAIGDGISSNVTPALMNSIRNRGGYQQNSF